MVRASRPTSWPRPRASAAAFRWAPAWRPREAAQGHDRRRPWHDLRRQSARHGGRQRRARRRARAEASSSTSTQIGLLLKQRLAELKDRHPTVIEEIRGQGLMLGLQQRVPNADFVGGGARAEAPRDPGRRQCRAAAAAADRRRGRDCARRSTGSTRACAALESAADASPRSARSAPNERRAARAFSRSLEHFTGANCARILDSARGHEGARAARASRRPSARSPARCWR